jgi:hypothetical protein
MTSNHEAPCRWLALTKRYTALLTQHDPSTAYAQWEAFRAWFNRAFPELECFLEDGWNEHIDGQTWIEVYLRSPTTKAELGPLAYDAYLNHSDERGVWHLGAYLGTALPPNGAPTAEAVVAFCKAQCLNV